MRGTGGGGCRVGSVVGVTDRPGSVGDDTDGSSVREPGEFGEDGNPSAAPEVGPHARISDPWAIRGASDVPVIWLIGQWWVQRHEDVGVLRAARNRDAVFPPSLTQNVRWPAICCERLRGPMGSGVTGTASPGAIEQPRWTTTNQRR
jgi:hypothetical protein